MFLLEYKGNYSMFNIVLVGDKSVGKTNFMSQHHACEFGLSHKPTRTPTMYTFTFDTNYGPLVFKVYDFPGNSNVSHIIKIYNPDAAIVMFDLSDHRTFDNALNCYFKDMGFNIPAILCGNKADKCKITKKMFETNNLKCNVDYCLVSAFTTHNIDKPWLMLAQQLTGHKDLVFIERAQSK